MHVFSKREGKYFVNRGSFRSNVFCLMLLTESLETWFCKLDNEFSPGHMLPLVLLYKLWQVEVGRSRAIFLFHKGATKRLKLRN